MTAERIEGTEDANLAWLLERRKHFDELVGSVEDYAIFMMSKDGKILDWNCGAELLKGYKPDEIIGKSFSTFYSAEEKRAKIPEEELEVAAAHGKFATEGWRIRKDGSTFWASVTITAIRTPDKEVAGFLKITRDLTERRQSLEALRQSEERLRLLIESVSDYAIFMLDPRGNIISWNTGARSIKGYSAEEIIGQHFSRFYPVEALSSGLPDRLLKEARERGSAEDEGWRIRKSGELFWASVLITSVTDDAGDHRGFVKITRDLTERKKNQELLQANEKKDTFLAMLAHELRNPLAPLAPGVEMILKNPHDTGRVIQIASMMRRQIGLISRLIEDLVDLSRITTGKITLRHDRAILTDVLESAIECVRPHMDAKNQRLDLLLPTGVVELDADQHRLVQGVSNLLANAAKYTGPEGQIELSAGVNDGILEIAVRDNGSGIEEGRLESIFDLFDQGGRESAEGLGIGLTLVRTIVELHGGNIVAKSAGEGRGSEFIARLPIVKAVAPSADEQENARQVSGSCWRMLVADDSRSSADTLALYFESEGFQAMVAYDGRQAVELAQRQRPDVVCLDIGMPVMNGLEAATAIRQIAPDAFIVAITGWGTEEDRKKTREAGFDLHLVKPVRVDELRSAIKRRYPDLQQGSKDGV